jgi:hypothetical protein
MNASLKCPAKHNSGLVCSMNWHTGPHKAALFDHGEPFIYEWTHQDSNLEQSDVPNIALYAPHLVPSGMDAEMAELSRWKLNEFAGKQLFPGDRTWRFTIRNNVAETLGVLVVCQDGLVTLYCARNGTFGHLWPGPPAFGKKGITAFLAECEAGYFADKLTMHLPDGKHKRVAQHCIVELWPFAVVCLKKSMEAQS